MHQTTSVNIDGFPTFLQDPDVVADAVEAVGQHVDQEPADELVGVERHRLVASIR
jgi:hypothetical protein